MTGNIAAIMMVKYVCFNLKNKKPSGFYLRFGTYNSGFCVILGSGKVILFVYGPYRMTVSG